MSKSVSQLAINGRHIWYRGHHMLTSKKQQNSACSNIVLTVTADNTELHRKQQTSSLIEHTSTC